MESDKFLRSKTDTSVYLVGDVLHYVPEGEEAPVPQVVENAEYSAECAAHNILVELTGEGEMEAYSPKLHGVMVCVGGRWGSAYVGTHKHKFGLPSFLAMFSKHFINMFYFAKVMGWTKIISYMKQRVLHHPQPSLVCRRSFLKCNPQLPAGAASAVAWRGVGV